MGQITDDPVTVNTITVFNNLFGIIQRIVGISF